MSENCPICGKKLTMLNSGAGGRLASGEKLCIPCLKQASRHAPDITLHSKRFTVSDIRNCLPDPTPQACVSASVLPTPITSPPKKKNGFKIFVGLLIIAFAIYFIVDLFHKPSDAENSKRVYYAAQEFVKEKLKSPTSAVFGKEYSYIKDGNRWKIEGTVDADNSFGAKLRSKFTVQLIYKGEGSLRDKNNYTPVRVLIE